MSPAKQMIFDQGTEVGIDARKRYPGGVLIDLDYRRQEEALKATQEALAHNPSAIFEAAATLMLAKGVDVKTVSEILGHEDLATTMIYVHLLGNRIKQVSKLFSIAPAAPKAAQVLALVR